MPTARTALPSSSPRPPTAPTLPASYLKRRSFIYAGGFAVITIAGTLIGATLKTRKQAEEKTEKKQQVQLDAGEQIAVLEETRGNLVQRRGVLERKIEEVREKGKKEGDMREERERVRREGEEVRREMDLRRRG